MLTGRRGNFEVQRLTHYQSDSVLQPLQLFCSWVSALYLLAWVLISAGTERSSLFSHRDKFWGQWHESLLCLPISGLFSRARNRASISGQLNGCWMFQAKGTVYAKLWQQNSIWEIPRLMDSTQGVENFMSWGWIGGKGKIIQVTSGHVHIWINFMINEKS